MPVQDLTVSGSPGLKAKKSLEDTQNSQTRPQKVGFVSLGCPKNLVDSEVMMGLVARAGAELTRRAEDADYGAEKLEPNTLLDGDDKLDIPTFLRKHPN